MVKKSATPNIQKTWFVISGIFIISLGVLFTLGYVVGWKNGSNEVYSLQLQNQRNTTQPNNSSKAQPIVIHVTSPKPGDTLCLGQYYDVVWDTPTDMEGLTLEIHQINDWSYDTGIIGQFSTGYGGNSPGHGIFKWRAGYTQDGTSIPPSSAYQITAWGLYKNAYQYGTTLGTFTLTNCNTNQ